MRILLTQVVYIFCCSNLFSQTIDDYVEEIGWGEFSTQFNYERPAPEVKGNYHLFDDWVVADLNLYADKIFKGKRLNLNILSGDIEVPHEDRIRGLDKTKVKSFMVGDRKFINSAHLEGSIHRTNTFLEVLEEGAINVYCQYYIVLRAPSYGVPGAGRDKDFMVLIRKTYFVALDSPLEIFSHSKKNNIKYFQNNQLAFEYIDKENLSINRIKGFVKAARYFNMNN